MPGMIVDDEYVITGSANIWMAQETPKLQWELISRVTLGLGKRGIRVARLVTSS